jgi:hypothetical protein
VYPDDDEGVMQTLGLMKGKSWISYREEWPRIREQLDQGKLATLGLVRTDSFDIGENHQVLAYAYQQRGQFATVWIYDPNFPADDTVTIAFDITDTASPARIAHSISDKPIYALLYLDNYSARMAPAGRPLPPPDRPRVVRLLEGDGRSVTTDGEVTREERNECGEPMRFGRWTTRTTISFVAQISGYLDPVVEWSVDGVPVAPEPGAVLAVAVGGVPFSIDTTIAPGGRILTLSSRPGDTYAVTVRVSVRDALGHTGQDEKAFEVEGHYEGFKLEDIAAAAQCIARTIPVPVDMYTIPRQPPGPVEGPLDTEVWAREAHERLAADPSVDAITRGALQVYIDTQVVTPEVRAVDRFRLNRTIPGLLR